MDPLVKSWDDVAVDNPVPLLTRRKVTGDKMLLAMIRLEKGCHVPLHQHDSEQFGYVISGRVTFTLGAEGSPERRAVEVVGGQVIQLPSNFPHGVDVHEDSVILDILAPPGPMGVDAHTK